jgi:hypothetical protein
MRGVIAVVLLSAGCSADRAVTEDAAPAKPAGTEGGPCFDDGTCEEGLTCASKLCVRVPDAAPPDTRGVKDAVIVDSKSFDAARDSNVDAIVPDAPADQFVWPDAPADQYVWPDAPATDKYLWPDAPAPLTCNELLVCVGNCGDDASCAQGCMFQADAAAAAAFYALQTCVISAYQGLCASDCAVLDSSECSHCLTTECQTEIDNCANT